MIHRSIEDAIVDKIGKGKAIIIYGPRQVGKTTLVNKIFADKENVVWLNGDELATRELFHDFSVEKARLIIGNADTLIIDEAQRIENIGINLKIIQDNFKNKVQVVATGSSSLDLANKINEPLTGRKWVYRLYPFSTVELANENGLISEVNNLPRRLIYGNYPDVVNNPDFAEEIIKTLANDDLYKDILNLGNIIKTDKLSKILQALAYQVGSKVSLREIAQLVELDHKTINKYIALLEQSFIIFRVSSFSRNLRNELKGSNKYYFYDTGIRNALINNFDLPENRSDIGGLFENYVMAEVKKRSDDTLYFWKNTDQNEIDLIREKNGNITATEIKWNEKKTASISRAFNDAYNPSSVDIVNRKNVTMWLMNQ